ncbi:MAG: B12-binding domain-containing radical SAM protein [Clostridiales bacterium]|nr:B12-binding domain-containing radical SAM protein [Clostridiales bacterium]
MSINRLEIMNITKDFLSMIKLPSTDKGVKKLNYLMVIPKFSSDDDAQYGFPLGFATVTSALKVSGRSVFNYNMNYKQEPIKQLSQIIIKNKIDVVMTTGTCLNVSAVKTVLETSKETNSNIITVVGGALITGDPIPAMETLVNADYGVIGEGEITVNAIAYALEIESDPALLDGVVCLRNGEWSVNSKYPSIPDLNILPFPDYEGFDYDAQFNRLKNYYQYRRSSYNYTSSVIGYISITRSCIYNCTFCFHPCGNKFRSLTMKNVFRQIDYLISMYNIEMLYMQAEMSFSNIEFGLEFCRRIKPYNLKWTASIHAGSITEGLLFAMKDSGCVHATLGIESASNHILRSMRKNVTTEQIEGVLKYAGKIGLVVLGNIIFGDPQETTETVQESINWWKKLTFELSCHKIRLNMINIFPGAHLYDIACKSGKITDRVRFLEDCCPLTNISKLTDDEYYTLPFILRALQLGNQLENVSVTSQTDFSLNIAGNCPHCKEKVNFSDFKQVFSISLQKCPNCTNFVNLNVIEYCDFAKLNERITHLAEESALVVWGVNQFNIYWLLESSPVLKDERVMFINESVYLTLEHEAKTLGGKALFKPEVISEMENVSVLAIGNPSVFKRIKQLCENKYSQVVRLIHISEILSIKERTQ